MVSKKLQLPLILFALIGATSCSQSAYNWSNEDINEFIETCKVLGAGMFPDGFDTSRYCRCTINRISESMTVDDAADASVEMLIGIENPSNLQGNSKIYFDVVKECMNKNS